MMSRSAEALKRLKPHELRALWLRAQGHSYSDIGAITGWSYTKVNRCLSEGRRSFLERYEGIESGAECARWLPVISAMVDGEATPEQLVDLRPHLRNCPGCRATLRALRDSSRPIAALLPVPLAVAGPEVGDHLANVFVRAYEAVVGGAHERAIHSAAKAQILLEASASGKVAAVAASAAAVAGGGYATVERAAERPAASRLAARAAAPAAAPPAAVKPKAGSWAAPRVGVAKTGAPLSAGGPKLGGEDADAADRVAVPASGAARHVEHIGDVHVPGTDRKRAGPHAPRSDGCKHVRAQQLRVRAPDRPPTRGGAGGQA